MTSAQRDAVAALAGTAEVLVVEGAAGAGKTTTLAPRRKTLTDQGHRLCVVAPTLKAAQVAGRELGSVATSAAWLVHQYGFRWDDTAGGPGSPRIRHPRPYSTAVTCCWSTRQECSTRTPPAHC